ncbi:MAG: hypothetical protein QXG91_00520 [Candidatus Aenigmatarchaeota archaeon]
MLEAEFKKFRESAGDFVVLFREHIDKKNNILYQLVDPVLNKKDKEEFEKIEEKTGKGVYERYEELGRKYGKENK